MRLTPNMRVTLQRARNGPLRRTHEPTPGQPAWPAPWQTLAALIRHELLAPGEIRNRKGYRVQVWTITNAGREALKPTLRVKRDTVTRLHVPGGTTRMMQGAEWVEPWMPEPEQVKNEELEQAWFGRAAERHAEAMNRRTAARAVRQRARRAA